MLTQENDVEIFALGKRGWNQSAISRHTGRDRKTVRKYLAAGEMPLVRERAASCVEPWRPYIEARFVDDAHLEASVLHRELTEAGFDRAYTTLVRELRRLELRPVCLVCAQRRGSAVTVEIDHPAGEEIQWDWLELDVTPWGEPAFVLVGALSHSGRFRAVFCEQMTFGHLAGAVHEVLVALGGTARVWRTDRMATIVIAGTDRLTKDAAQLAKHYGTEIAVCPARRAQRKGVVEAAIKYLTKSWWRTAPVTTIGEAQNSMDAWSVIVADARQRPGGTVGELGASEPLSGLPAMAYPALIEVQRRASRSALVAFEANEYSVPPAHAGRMVAVLTRVGEPLLKIVSTAGELVAEHRRAPRGAGQTIRTPEHARLLETAVLAAFTTENACRRKPNLPPGQNALAELARLRRLPAEQTAVVVSLADYAALAQVAR
jgi:transposase